METESAPNRSEKSQGQVNFDWAPQSAKEARQEARVEASETGTGGGLCSELLGWTLRPGSSSGWAVVGRKGRGHAASEVEEAKPKAMLFWVLELVDVLENGGAFGKAEAEDERPADGPESGDLTQVPEVQFTMV